MEKAQTVASWIIVVLIVMTLIIVAVQEVQQGQNTANTSNESNEIATGIMTLTPSRIVSVSGLRNASMDNVIGQCNVTVPSPIILCNTSVGNTAFADYTYLPESYIDNTSARGLMLLTALLVVAVFLIALWKNQKMK